MKVPACSHAELKSHYDTECALAAQLPQAVKTERKDRRTWAVKSPTKDRAGKSKRSMGNKCH
jgi:hypothetical protein